MVSGVSGNTVLDRSARMEVLIESLSTVLGFSVKASVVETARRDSFARFDAFSQRNSSTINAGGYPVVNMMFFKGTIALYSSMIRQMFLCWNETEVS